MAQILTIKTQLINHDFDDILGIFDDGKKFVEGTLDRCNLYQIKGFTGEELRQYLYDRQIQRTRLYKSKTPEWTSERPERNKGWKHIDGKWYFLEKEGLQWTIKDLTADDKNKLASEVTLSSERLQILGKIKPNIPEYPENFTEVPKIIVGAKSG